MFRKTVHCLRGSLEGIDNLAYSFTVTEDRGALTLLHTVEDSEIEDLRDTF